MKQELRNAFGKVFLTISPDLDNRWVHTDWAGYLTQDNIKTGALAYAKTVKEAGFNCVLNDTRQVVGSWDHSLDWVLNEWAPQAAAAGIRFFALIATPESFAESTASSFYSKISAFEVKMFNNEDDARTWLHRCSSGK